MIGVCRLDTRTLQIFKYVDDMIDSNYPIDHRDCIKQAIREFVPEYEFIDLYSLYDITYDQYVEDMGKSYLRYKNQRLSELWQERANSTEQ